MSRAEGDLLHTVTADDISDGRKRLGKLMVWGSAGLCAALALWQMGYETGRLENGFDNWRPILYAYVLWAFALCAAQVIVNGEKGKRTLFVLPAALFVISLVVFPLLFALYTLLTRYAARKDTAETSFFWTGIAGAVAISLVGIWFWEPMAPRDWLWMLGLCITGASGHYLLIKTYEIAEASAVQPFAYLHLVFVAVIGLLVFNEDLRINVVIGAGLVIAAGIFTLWRARRATA